MMTAVWEHSKQSSGELLVLLALADFANDAGEAWPSLQVLAAKARISKSHVTRVLENLEHAGEIIRNRTSGGRNQRTHYRVIVDSENGCKTQPLHGRNGCMGAHETVASMQHALNRHKNRHQRERPKTPFPKNFQISQEARILAAQLGVDPDSEFAKFRDHAVAHGSKYANWEAALRNWFRRAHDFTTNRHVGKSKQQTEHDRYQEFANAALKGSQ